jgi:predicted SAM-dependent methyltransferase
MFLEHLDPVDEIPFFLNSCYYSLQPNGILRIIVPDAHKFIKAYMDNGWNELNKISYGLEDWSKKYSSKMEALNYVFLQGYEHYGGWDKERLLNLLSKSGFTSIKFVDFGIGDFPNGPIDREYHKLNALYVEAKK